MRTRKGRASRAASQHTTTRDEAARARLKRARTKRKAAKKAQTEAARAAEAEQQKQRRSNYHRPRRPIEPEIFDGDSGGLHRAGWVAIMGRPNVGKSTLLNALLGQKLAPTSHKPQTTRKNLLGVLNPKGAQILLLDTPGHHLAKGPLNRFMVSQAEGALRDADVILFVVEARGDGRITPGNERVLSVLKRYEKPVVVAMNKVDRVDDKANLLLQINNLQSDLGSLMAALVPVSALHKTGLDRLVKELGFALPESEPLLGPDEVTDRSEREIVAEFIREKAMLELKEEIPYSVAVTIEHFDDIRPKLVRLRATVHVERSSQKGIVIGKQGSRLRTIGTRARKDIEFLLGSKVYMELSVKVTEEWSRNPQHLQRLGYTKRDDYADDGAHVELSPDELELIENLSALSEVDPLLMRSDTGVVMTGEEDEDH
ncbi:MAG: GTPase Era [Myxococcales bacterium]|nr:GTPase Era [Myxococcales bacterium]